MKCDHCGCEFFASSLGEHMALACPEVRVECGGCGELVVRRVQAGHEEAHCPAHPVDCPYAANGCPERPQRSRLKEHVADAVLSHAQLISSALQASKDEARGFKDELNELKARPQSAVYLEWTVERFRHQIGQGVHYFMSQDFRVVDYELGLCVAVKVIEGVEWLRLSVHHSGGSSQMPIPLSGTALTLKGETTDSDFTREFNKKASISSPLHWYGFERFTRIADLEGQGLCRNDQLQIAARVCVRTSQTLRTAHQFP